MRYWIAKGMPLYKGAALSRFPEWLSIMGGILDCIGIEGIIANYEERTAAVSVEQSAWEEYVTAWAEAHGSRSVKISELLPLAFGGLQDGKMVGGPLLEAIPKLTAANRAQMLGAAQRQRLDRVFADHQIRAGKKRDGYPTYYLEAMK